MITVYSQPNCGHCNQAIAYLSENNIPFHVLDIRQDADALAFMQAEGHRSTPQLYVGKVILAAGGNAGLRTLSRDQILARVDELT